MVRRILVEGTKQASSVTYLYVSQEQYLSENNFLIYLKKLN